MAFDIANQAVGIWENLSDESNPSIPREKKKSSQPRISYTETLRKLVS